LRQHRIAVNISFFLNGFIYANWVSRLPRIQEQYNADNGTIGIVLLSLSLGAVVAMPFTGWMIIKNGSRKVTLISLLAYCALVPLIPLMARVPVLVLLYVVMGAFTGMLDVAMNAQAVMVEQQYKKPIMTSFHAFFSIGMALGAWCGSLFSDLDLHLIYHFLTISITALCACVWVSQNLIHDKPAQASQDEGPLFRVPSRSLIGVGIIAFCCMMGEGSMADWTVNYMEKITGASRTLAPIALSAFATAMTLGRLTGDKIREKYGDSFLIVAGGLVSTFGLFIALLVPLSSVAIAGFFLVGLGLSTIVPITYSIAGNTKDLPSGVGLAMVTTVGYSGFLFGPPIIGFVSDVFNLRIGLAVVLVLFIIMTVLGLARKKNS
jgi:MFS family permease